MVQGQRTRQLEATFARRRRILLIAGCCVWGALWARTFFLQVISGAPLKDVAEKQTDRDVRLVAPRGHIVDARGHLLAISVGRESFFGYPNRETSARVLAARFAPIVGARTADLIATWEGRNNRYTVFARRCNDQAARDVRSWQLPGVYATNEYERLYPCIMPEIADPIGFVNDALSGAAGLELFYDHLLAGVDGEGSLLRDASGRGFSIDPVPVKPSRPGARLQLTLDWSWQSILAEELKSAVEKWHAHSGMGLLMNPNTGAILAMVDYDPNGLGSKARKNRLVSDVMEPGSTFKIVTYAAALSDGTISLRRLVDGGNGQGQFSGRTLHDDKHHGVMTAAEAFIVSSNVATARIANLLRPDRLNFWVRRFGFGEATGIDLPGESPGRIATQKPTEINIATLSIGHGVAVTPVQLAAAYASVANGGYLVRPHLLKSFEEQDGKFTEITVQGRRILRPEVACLMKKIMAGVVHEGTAKVIYDSLYPIAGKTGTAEKPNLKTHTYDKSKFMATFVGFYPVFKPRILGVVILDEPQQVHYGGYTAAPVLLNAIRRGATGVDDADDRRSPYEQPSMADSPMAALSDSDQDWARRFVDVVAPAVSFMEAHAELPDAGDTAPALAEIASVAGNPDGANAWGRFVGTNVRKNIVAPPFVETWPDLKGLSLRDAMVVLRQLGARWEVEGTGAIVAQFPPADSAMTEDRTCRLILQ